MPLFSKILSTCLCILLASICHGQLVHFTKHYKKEDGLANRSISKLIRDDQGKTWIFARNDIQIYDGANFRTLNHNIGLLEDENIVCKIDTNKILILKDTIAWVLDTRKENFSSSRIDSFTDYLPVHQRLYSYDKRKNTILLEGKVITKLNHPVRPKKLVSSSANEIAMICKDSTLYYYNDKSWLDLGKTDKLIGFIRDSLIHIRNDSLFFCTPKTNQHYFKKSASYALIRKDHLDNVMLATSNDPRRFLDFLLYTDTGIYDYSEVAKDINTIRDFYSDNFTQHILLATYNGLIYSSFSNYVAKYNYNDKLSSAQFGAVIWWIIERKKTGDIYFAKEVAGFFKLDADGSHLINPYAPAKNKYTANFFGKYHEPSDRLYSFSFNSKVSTLHIWDFKNQPIDINLEGRYYSIAEVDDRFLSFSGKKEGKAHRIIFDTQDIKISDQYYIDGVGNNIFDVVKRDATEYIAGPNGIFTLDTNSKGIIDTLSTIATLSLWAHQTTLLGGTDGFGIQIFKNGRLYKTINKEDGLVDNTVHSLQADQNGNFWLGTLNGISVLNQDFEIIKNIRKEDGLSSSELNTESLYCTEDKVYAGTINGLSVIDQSILELHDYYPLVKEEISIPNHNNQNTTRNIIGENNILSAYGVDSLEVVYKYYQLFHYNHYQDYTFQNAFTLDGKSVKLTKNRLPLNLALGKNVLEHKLINSVRESNEEVKFVRETFLQKFGVFILTGLLILALLIALYFLNRKRIKEKQEATLKALNCNLDSMRASALRAQMNPHFIFNALGSIQYYIQRQESEKAEEYLSDFSVLIRSTLESSKEDYSKISQEIEMVSLYLKLEHLRFEERFDYEIIVGDEIDQTLEIPSMVIQPYIENAINHGVYHLTDRKGFIKVRLYESTMESIICEIVDNGIGREASNKYRKKNHKSRALSNIKERLEIMNHLQSNELYVDISDRIIDGEVKGTIVKIKFA